MAFSPFSIFSGRPQHTDHHYDPNQPRVPAGHSDGGQWTRDTSGTTDPKTDEGRVLSDVTPDNEWQPGARYAARRWSGRGGSLAPSPGQAARLAVAEARANELIRQIRQRDWTWRPRPSVYETIEGQIAAAQAKAQEAESYLAALLRIGFGPGRFACCPEIVIT